MTRNHSKQNLGACEHGHHHHADSTKSLKTAFLLNFTFAFIEIIGGLFTNSIAVLADALHDFGDALALGMAWYLEKLSHSPKSKDFTFGYRRFSVLAAAINLGILFLGSVFLVIESLKRFQSPENVHAPGMMGMAVLGLLVNGIGAYKLYGHRSQNHSVAFWHLIEDLLGWLAVLLAAVVIHFTSFMLLDSILSIVIQLIILSAVFKRIPKILRIFLQGAPENIDMMELQNHINQIKGVKKINSLQTWTLDGQEHVLTCHLEVDMSEHQNIKMKINEITKPLGFIEICIEVTTNS